MRSSPSSFLCLLALLAGPAVAAPYQTTAGFSPYQPLPTDDARTQVLWAARAGEVTANAESVVALPFGFRFYGVTHTQLVVSTNGYVSFDGAGSGSCDGCGVNRSMGAASAPNNFIAVLWDDLRVARHFRPGHADARVSVRVLGEAPHRVFQVEWLRMGVRPGPDACATCSYSFASAQLSLSERTQSIRLHYGPGNSYAPPNYPTDYGGLSFSAGVEGPPGMGGQNLSFPTFVCASAAVCHGVNRLDGYFIDLAPSADLAVASVSGPAALRPGAPITVQVTLENPTGLAAPSRSYRLALSTDAVLSPDDADIAVGVTRQVAAAQTHVLDVEATLPPTLLPGDYFLLFVLAPGDAVKSNDVGVSLPTPADSPIATFEPTSSATAGRL